MQFGDQQSDSGANGGDEFATTQWSLVLAAGEGAGANSKSDRALEKLCRTYWPPLYAYVRRRVSDLHEAQDLTQAFFERLLEKRFLAQADPERGRFRNGRIRSRASFRLRPGISSSSWMTMKEVTSR